MSDSESALAAKKAEIDKILDEFAWHCSRVEEISREAGRLIESMKEHGAAAAPAVIASWARLQRIAEGAERRPTSNVA